MTVGPGWYPDPIGDFEQRWWDGQVWTDHVVTGRFTTVSPPVETPIPHEESQVWTDGNHWLTTHQAFVNEGRGPLPVPWWSVAGVDVRVRSGQSLMGTGDIVLTIAYPGYVDRRERRMKGVASADAVAAVCFTWSRRHRKAAGYS